MSFGKYKQGIYQVKNREKYIGTKDPRYLSSYEYKFFAWADRSKSVTKWGAEVVVVPYFNEPKNRKARYIVDVYLEYIDKNGEIRRELIEIKPITQVQPPRKGKKRKDVYENEVLTFIQNQNKWKAAEKYAEERGWNFRIITENSLFKG
jgi:hypothetical protein